MHGAGRSDDHRGRRRDDRRRDHHRDHPDAGRRDHRDRRRDHWDEDRNQDDRRDHPDAGRRVRHRDHRGEDRGVNRRGRGASRGRVGTLRDPDESRDPSDAHREAAESDGQRARAGDHHRGAAESDGQWATLDATAACPGAADVTGRHPGAGPDVRAEVWGPTVALRDAGSHPWAMVGRSR